MWTIRRLFPLICAGLLGPVVVVVVAQDYAQAGALAKNGRWEIGVLLDPSVSRDSAVNISHYSLGEGRALEAIRYVALNHSVVLTASSLETNTSYSLSITNLTTLSGQLLPPLSLPFTAKPASWDGVGGRELGFDSDAVAVGETGFDLVSGGVQFWERYDESTFVFEQVTGDFDKRIRVEMQEPSSEAARAGLMVREAVDAGRPRPSDPFDPAAAFSRYLQIHVNPVATAIPNGSGGTLPGLNSHQANFRPFLGGIGSPNFDATENPALLENAAPAYPQAWLRLKRAGDAFHVFRGTDGTNWIQLGTFTFPRADAAGQAVAPFASTVLIGPNYSPEVGNIPEGAGTRRAFLARFRDYSDASGEVQSAPTLKIVSLGEEIEISWNGGGTLQTSMNLKDWTELPVPSPVRTIPVRRQQFFRVRVP